MKKLLPIFFLLFCYSIFAQKPIPVKTQLLKTVKPSTSYFSGIISPIKTGKFGTFNPGLLTYTASPGELVYAQIKDTEGNIIRQGTPIIKQDTTLAQLAVDIAKLELEEAQSNLLVSSEEFKRTEKLQLKDIVSVKALQVAKADYQNSQLAVKTAEVQLKQAEFNFESCIVYPEFTGQVDEVYYTPGTSLDHFNDIVKLTMMNPIFVKMSLPLTLVNKIGYHNLIKVYSEDSPEPVVGLLSKNPTNPTKINILIVNYVMADLPLTEKEKGIPVIHKILYTIHAYISKELFMHGEIINTNTPLAVPETAIKKDKKGFFVWQAADQEVFEKAHPPRKHFILKKIYVKPGNIYRHVNFIPGLNSNYRSLEESGTLQPTDIVAIDVPEGIKDGTEVIYQQLRWRFTPGEKVIVTISEIEAPGFYVPINAIFNVNLGNPQVCIVEDGKAKFVNIQETGIHNFYIRIEGKYIKEGGQIVLDINNTLQNVYDGAPLEITDTIEPLLKLNYNVAKEYNPILESAHKLSTQKNNNDSTNKNDKKRLNIFY